MIGLNVGVGHPQGSMVRLIGRSFSKRQAEDVLRQMYWLSVLHTAPFTSLLVKDDSDYYCYVVAPPEVPDDIWNRVKQVMAKGRSTPEAEEFVPRAKELYSCSGQRSVWAVMEVEHFDDEAENDVDTASVTRIRHWPPGSGV